MNKYRIKIKSTRIFQFKIVYICFVFHKFIYTYRPFIFILQYIPNSHLCHTHIICDVQNAQWMVGRRKKKKYFSFFHVTLSLIAFLPFVAAQRGGASYLPASCTILLYIVLHARLCVAMCVICMYNICINECMRKLCRCSSPIVHIIYELSWFTMNRNDCP